MGEEEVASFGDGKPLSIRGGVDGKQGPSEAIGSE